MSTEFQVPSYIFRSAPRPIANDYWRRCHRVFRMLSVLHGKGFHGIRIFPYNYPLAYRIALFPARYADADGVKYRDGAFDGDLRDRLLAVHSGANEKSYFGWDDAQSADAHQLALLFIERFPDLCREAYYLDFAYAGWFSTLLAHCDYGCLPYLYDEYQPEIGKFRMNQFGAEGLEYFPLPPTANYGQSLVPNPEIEWLQK